VRSDEKVHKRFDVIEKKTNQLLKYQFTGTAAIVFILLTNHISVSTSALFDTMLCIFARQKVKVS